VGWLSATLPSRARRKLAAHSHVRVCAPYRPQITEVGVRFRAQFAYVAATLTDGGHLPPCRLRYGGSASRWGFAVYRASHDDYEPSMLPSGEFAGTPEEALDCACGLYLGDPPPGSPTHQRRTNRQKH
jgi:hypothetical protein